MDQDPIWALKEDDELCEGKPPHAAGSGRSHVALLFLRIFNTTRARLILEDVRVGVK